MNLLLHPSKMTPNEIRVDLKSLYQSGSGTFLDDVKAKLLEMKVPSVLRAQFTNSNHPLCLHTLVHKFCTTRDYYDKSFDNLKGFVETALKSFELDKEMALKTKVETQNQSSSPLWRLLRYGRITASSLAAAAGCKKDTSEERMVLKVFGAENLKATEAMTRGLRIENEVRRVFCRDKKRRVQLGHFAMSHKLPLFGASPDGIGSDFILEIKSPKENKNIVYYLKADGTPTKKVLLQMLLQTKLCEKKKGYLLIPDENFESNEMYKCVEVEFDEDSIDPHQIKLREIFYDAIEKAETFYKKNVHPKLIERMRPILV